ncbi:MAG: 2,3,4,5-tetrahydropyridine-2,6-dicarboxylate N-succinyltransferase [Rickettsiales bacterium]|nr:2,3,4,5-tetrahydropyridine-2,6-dicarboxylate N-succinyltransferase [Rickettsiales bacterium]
METEQYSPQELENIIEDAWNQKDQINTSTSGTIQQAVEQVLKALGDGSIRVSEKSGSDWIVNQWVKKAILLSFRLNDNIIMEGGAAADGSTPSAWFDKIPSKFAGWNRDTFLDAGFRAVPGSFVRDASFVGKNVVLMPSFINIGAYVDDGTMVDTWATIGSCAQIGKNCHISGGTGIGGVLEPLQANPVIIEDNCFIGARSEVAEGVIVGEGSVISMGVFIGASTKIVDRETGEITYGKIPPYSVVVPGSLPAKSEGKPSLYCAVIVKKVDEKTRSKTSINELLRGE